MPEAKVIKVRAKRKSLPTDTPRVVGFVNNQRIREGQEFYVSLEMIPKKNLRGELIKNPDGSQAMVYCEYSPRWMEPVNPDDLLDGAEYSESTEQASRPRGRPRKNVIEQEIL